MEKRLNNHVLPEVSEVDLIFRSDVKAYNVGYYLNGGSDYKTVGVFGD